MDFELENAELNIEAQSGDFTPEDNTQNLNLDASTNTLGFETPEIGFNYNNAANKPSINGVQLIGNKTTEDLGIVGTSMTEIEISTDMTNPTEILNYIGKSGTYVAKNLGVVGSNGEPVTAFAKGQFFNVSNLQEYAKAFGIEVPDSQNVIDVDARILDGTYITYRITGGTKLEEIVWLNSKNVNDYVDGFNPADFINSSYGIRIYSNKLATNPATQTDIDNGYDTYKPITSNMGAYLVQQKGKNYFADKTEINTLKDDVSTLGTDLDTLKTEIETILESVVAIDE